MNKKSFTAGVIAFFLLLLNRQLVLAHESITIGDYTLELGWLSEPPIVGQQNAIVVNVSKGDKQPVEDVSTLTVTISYGGQNKTLTLQPLGEDTPGQFVAPILPTVPGEYTVTLGGKLGDTPSDAETHVEEVQPATMLEFPIVDSSPQNADLGMMNWLIYLSLLIGLTGLILGVMALRKPR
jgi:hypothetical protein